MDPINNPIASRNNESPDVEVPFGRKGSCFAEGSRNRNEVILI